MKFATIAILATLVARSAQAQRQAALSAEELANMASPSIVRIEVYSDDKKLTDSNVGFVVSADGVILTNYRSIAYAKRATVWLANGDAYDEISVLDVDRRKDLALVKIKAVDLAPLKLGRADALQPGDALCAVGPVSDSGIMISDETFTEVRQETGYRLFELTAARRRASAGSPLLNSRGEVVGIIEAATNRAQTVDLAIPIEYAAGMLASPGAARSLASVAESSDSDSFAKTNAAPRPSAALQGDTIAYLTEKIRVWTAADAAKELGVPGGSEEAVDIQTANVIGDTFKYTMPSSQFDRIELTFDHDSKLLTVVYLYPKGALASATMQRSLGNSFVKFTNPNGMPSYIYQQAQRTISVQADVNGDVVNIMIW